jgi:hypothetical protein
VQSIRDLLLCNKQSQKSAGLKQLFCLFTILWVCSLGWDQLRQLSLPLIAAGSLMFLPFSNFHLHLAVGRGRSTERVTYMISFRKVTQTLSEFPNIAREDKSQHTSTFQIWTYLNFIIVPIVKSSHGAICPETVWNSMDSGGHLLWPFLQITYHRQSKNLAWTWYKLVLIPPC